MECWNAEQAERWFTVNPATKTTRISGPTPSRINQTKGTSLLLAKEVPPPRANQIARDDVLGGVPMDATAGLSSYFVFRSKKLKRPPRPRLFNIAHFRL